MIQTNIEHMMRTQPTGALLSPSALKTAAIGSALALAISVFTLKHDITKSTIDLSRDIRDVRQNVEKYHGNGSAAAMGAGVGGINEESIYIIDRPCIDQVDAHLHEVYACSMQETRR